MGFKARCVGIADFDHRLTLGGTVFIKKRRIAERAAAVCIVALASAANAAGNDADIAINPARIGNDTDIAAGTARVAAVQILNGWVLKSDMGDFDGAAKLFTPGGKLSLYYNDTSSLPQKITPTGRSAAPTATGGAEGGGCAAQGRTAIANFLQGRGPTYGPTGLTVYPVPTQRNTLDNTIVAVDAGRRTATARGYLTPAPPGWDNSQQYATEEPANPLWLKLGSGAPAGGLLWARLTKDPKAGWQIADMKIVFNTAQPAYPCKN
jgi:hypothetical protein